MLSIRRLRAVLMLATVSAVVWGLVAAFVTLGFTLVYGRPLRAEVFTGPLVVFGFFGFVAGAFWAVAIGVLPSKQDQEGVSSWRASIIGAIGGVLVCVAGFALLADAPLSVVGDLLIPATFFGVVGAATGIAIQRTAQRGVLGAGEAAVSAAKLKE